VPNRNTNPLLPWNHGPDPNSIRSPLWFTTSPHRITAFRRDRRRHFCYRRGTPCPRLRNPLTQFVLRDTTLRLGPAFLETWARRQRDVPNNQRPRCRSTSAVILHPLFNLQFQLPQQGLPRFAGRLTQAINCLRRHNPASPVRAHDSNPIPRSTRRRLANTPALSPAVLRNPPNRSCPPLTEAVPAPIMDH